MATKVKSRRLSQKQELCKEVPKLVCHKCPSEGLNDGEYTVTIPLEYVLAALKAPAAYFVFKFVGLRYRELRPTKEGCII